MFFICLVVVVFCLDGLDRLVDTFIPSFFSVNSKVLILELFVAVTNALEKINGCNFTDVILR